MSDSSDSPEVFTDVSEPRSETQSKGAQVQFDDNGASQPGDDGQVFRSASQQELLDSQVSTATSVIQPEQHKTTRSTPLSLDWAFGFNSRLPVFCLQDDERLVIVYVCAHVAVIYDSTANTQHLLQGHCSPISCACVSEDRRWLVTADRGQESLVIIWDTYTGIPVRTMFDCHREGGTVALALSHDSKHLVTVGSGDGNGQRLCVWDWSSESETPLCMSELPEELGNQKHIMVHPSDNTQLISNSQSRVLFYQMEGKTIEYSAPDISDKTFNKAVGAFSQSVFYSGGEQAYSATSLGNVLIWSPRVWGGARAYSALKLVTLQPDAITVLMQMDSYVVTADCKGHVKFYDSRLRLLSHNSDLGLDSIVSLSSGTRRPAAALGHPEDCTLAAKPFLIRNLLVSTAAARVVHVISQGGRVQNLMTEHANSLPAVACHPSHPIVAMGSNSGILKLWDYERRQVVCTRLFQKDPHIQCLAYDPQGVHLAVGFAGGGVCVLHACSLHSEQIEVLPYCTDLITHMAFSHDSTYLATADEGRAVTLFQLCQVNAAQQDGGQGQEKRKEKKEQGQQQGQGQGQGQGQVTERWAYLGRHHSHYLPIQELLFGQQLDTGLPRLLSLGQDRRLMEYDLLASGGDRLVLLSAERVEQSGVPTCMAWYPPLTTESFLLTAADTHKMKLYNATTKMCRKTLLGPCFGSPLRKMMLLPKNSDGDPKARYMAYITTDKVGLQILPLDGNPHRCSGQLCYSTGVSSLAVSHEGRYAFTTGGHDCTAFCWKINLSALEAAAALGGKDLEPFYSLLEGGRDGDLFREMEDYFYYSQLRSQGIDSMQARQVSTHIPLAEVPFVMRALGFYPTEQELEDMQNEVKFSRYAETGQYVTHVDLPDFIRLFVNHRPAQGLRLQELQWAFSVLGDRGGQGISRDRLLELLQARGEHMTEEELAECFSSLLGVGPEGGRTEATHWQDTDTTLEREMPEEVTFEAFVRGVLGFPLGCPQASGASSDASSELLA
ncbi:cilia- and flagella-associated protein 251 [Engraulis encrasicolus]|uniref:cilia- and flagella-associated protein 251 n=1 Tax=Engraulis encrasicolus TaxID=184585 RepID=UPI002FD64A1F